MAEFPAMPLWTDAYLGDTTHLDTTEHGAYLLLLITAWRTRDCSLADDDRLLARYARCSASQWKKLRPILEPFFQISDGKWRQGRLTDEFGLVRRRREIAAQNGKASALKRKGRHSAEREQSDSDEGNGARAERKRQGQQNSSDEGNLTTSTTTTKAKDKSLASAKEHPLPDDWEPKEFGDGTQSRGIVDGWSRTQFEIQLERFAAHHRSRKTRYSDWQQAWRTWVLNSIDFDQHRGSGRRSGAPADDRSALVDSVLADAEAARAKRK